MSMVKFNENVGVGYQSYSQQYQLGKGLKKFGEKGHKASSSELEQLHHRKCFYPVSVKDMTRNERLKAQMAMMLLTEKDVANSKAEWFLMVEKRVNGSPKKISQALQQHWRAYCKRTIFM